MAFSLTLDQIRSYLRPPGRETGALPSPGFPLTRIASLEDAGPGDLAFLANPKYKGKVAGSRASVILLPEDFDGEPQTNQVFIRVPHPSLALAQVCQAVERQLDPAPDPGIHASATVDPTARIDPTARVGPQCVIGPDALVGPDAWLTGQAWVGRVARVGAGTRIMPGVVIGDYCQVGGRCRIHAGTVIGSDGFGYATVDGRHVREPQVGRIIIEDDVEIGANCTLDRARFSETRIGEGTRIDNLVQVGHNVRVGRHCLIVAQVGISGSTRVEDYVVLGGQVGVAGHITVGQGAMVAAQSGLNRDVAPGEKVRGTPHMPMTAWARIQVLERRLPEFFKRFAKLEETVAAFVAQETERSPAKDD
ncbi:MAG: UDP-3-O-(3-hydroxymyristoyl)glucosamine N-acyltransferase [Opitutales bacterium]